MGTLTLHNSRWVLMIALLLFVVSVDLSFAEIPPAFVKTELKKNEKIWLGQRQTLYVKLYTSTSFSGSTRFELPKVSGMIIMESEDRPLLGTEKIDGVSYIFKQHEIFLFPQHAGSLTVPPFDVEFSFQGVENKSVEQNFSTHGLQFSVEKIPGAEPGKSVITTTNFRVDDHWEPVPEKAKVGDAFTRTITMTADDLPGMALPIFKVQKIEGLGIYSKQAQLADQMQRGKITGKRIETITYVCEQKGAFTLTGATLQWWNPENESLQEIVLDTVELKVKDNLLLQKEGPADSKGYKAVGFPWKLLVVIVFISALAVAVFIRLSHRIKQQSSQATVKQKELFKKFQNASASHDPASTMQTLLHWLDYSELTGSSGNLERFIELADDSDLALQIETLETILYATGSRQQWSGDKLYNAVRRARKKLRQNKALGEQQSLPALNP